MKAITAVLAIGAVALGACGSSDKSSSSSSSAGGAYGGGASKTTTASTSSSASRATEVEMYDNYFQPKSITGKPGSTVKVELKNEGKRKHNFKIDGQKADADVAPGERATVSVVIPKSGTVQFYCEYHKGLGMTGTAKAT